MKTTSHYACVALACAAWACSEAPDESPPAVEPEPILIQDANNYRATGSLSIPRIETAPTVDLDICWSELDKDLLCNDLSPATDINNVGLLRVSRYTQEEVEERLAADDLPQAAVDGYVQHPTSEGETCAKLETFSFFETVIPLEELYTASEERPYLMLFTSGIAPGIGARSMLFLEPREGSTRTRVDAPSGCGTLEFSADLASAEPLAVPAEGPWLFDWRGLARNGLGNEAFHAGIDRALVGFYADRSLAELEAGIFQLESSATELYRIELTGERATDLAAAREASTGAEFSGFARDAEGVWLFGLLCSTCRNPAPILLTVLTPAERGA